MGLVSGTLRQHLLDQALGLLVGALVSGTLSMFLVSRKLDRLDERIEQQHINQLGRDAEQDRRLNNLEATVYLNSLKKGTTR